MTAFFASSRPLGLPTALVALVLGGGLFAMMGLRNAPEPLPPALADGTFRACALSQDMPLSNERPDEYSGRSGLYLDLAEAMAERQNADFQSHLAVTAFYKRPVREGLLAGKCDAYFGLPRGEGDWFVRDKVALTKSFMSIGYALAVPNGVSVDRLEDLKGKTVAVQGGSPGAIAVSYIDGIETRTYRFATPALEDLEEGTVDAALVWGPKAGYYTKHVSPGAFTVRATSLQWPVAIGVRAADRESMVPMLESLIDDTQSMVAELRDTYGLPSGDAIPVELRSTASSDANDGSEATSSVEGIGRAAGQAMVEQTLVSHLDGYNIDDEEGDPEKGKKYFNSIYGCAHCHGPDGMGAAPGTNLQTIVERYGGEEEAREVFNATVREGRDGTAMPPWEGVISDEKIKDLEAFIFSVQKEE